MNRVVVEATGDDLARVAGEIPRAETLERGTRLVVFTGKSRGWLGKLLASKGAPASVLGSALLARGYLSVGAGEENGRPCAWGEA